MDGKHFVQFFSFFFQIYLDYCVMDLNLYVVFFVFGSHFFSQQLASQC